MVTNFLDDRVTLHPGDCLDVLATLPENSIDACVTDPPYHLTSIVKRFGAEGAAPVKVGKTGAYARASAGFMGKQWDGGDIAFDPETWAAVYRVMKPGAHLVAFGGTRTYHRMACAIEDAGFEIRDQIAWIYGSGFPKSHDVSKAIDRAFDSDRPSEEASQWQGWGTSAKPAWEPIAFCAKPLPLKAVFAILFQDLGTRLWSELCRKCPLPASDADEILQSFLLKCEKAGANTVVDHARTSVLANPESAVIAAASSTSHARTSKKAMESIAPESARESGNGSISSGTEIPITAADATSLNPVISALLLRQTNIDWSTFSLWRRISDAVLDEARTYTIETATEQTIALRTLSFFLSQTTPVFTRDNDKYFSPNLEPIVLARKPLIGTIAANVLLHGTGALNIGGCRVEGAPESTRFNPAKHSHDGYRMNATGAETAERASSLGRWPANLIHDGSEEVLAVFPESNSSDVPRNRSPRVDRTQWRNGGAEYNDTTEYGDSGSAARFFASFPREDERCPSIKSANDEARTFALQSEHVVSALSNAVAMSADRQTLQRQSYRAPNMNVSDQQLKLIVASVTETIQNIERRFAFELPPEKLLAKLGPVTCVAIPNPTGITTITVNLLMSSRCVEAVTFDIIETSEEVGAQGFDRRFHYTAKADAEDRIGSKHPTVKPLDLMQYLCRLITPPGGTVLDMFAGTGTTGEAAWREGFKAILIEREAEYQADIARRMDLATKPSKRSAIAKGKGRLMGAEGTPLFK
jgi:DNA modification methylase